MDVKTNLDDRLLFWVTFTVLMIGVGLTDAAVVAWNASVAGFWELLVSLFSFAMVSAGLVFTIWRMRRCT